MDELKLVRETGKDVAVASDSMLDGGRHQLLRRISAGETPQPKKRGKKTLRIAIMSVATAEAAEVLSTNLWLSMTSAHNPPDEEWVWERSGRIPPPSLAKRGRK